MDKVSVTESPVDYAVLMKEVLMRIKEGINMEGEALDIANLSNLTNTALDYLFYLEDNRRVLM